MGKAKHGAAQPNGGGRRQARGSLPAAVPSPAVDHLRPPGLSLQQQEASACSDGELVSGTVERERRRVGLAAKVVVSELQCVLGARLGRIESIVGQLLDILGHSAVDQGRSAPSPRGRGRKAPVDGSTTSLHSKQPEQFDISSAAGDEGIRASEDRKQEKLQVHGSQEQYSNVILKQDHDASKINSSPFVAAEQPEPEASPTKEVQAASQEGSELRCAAHLFDDGEGFSELGIQDVSPGWTPSGRGDTRNATHEQSDCSYAACPVGLIMRGQSEMQQELFRKQQGLTDIADGLSGRI